MVVFTMTEISASEYAVRHGISTRRVQAAASSGLLDARQIGGRWIIDDATPHRHAPGRPLSGRSAAALLACLSDAPEWTVGLSATEQRRTAKRVADLRRDARAPETLAAWLRAAHPAPEGYEVQTADLADLRTDARLTPGGTSDDRSGMSDGGRFEAHVSSSDVPTVIQEYLLVPSQRPNVLLRVHDGEAPRPLALGDLIADLSTSLGPRERSAAARLMREGFR